MNPEMNDTTRTALVTGATRGIGVEIARQLAAAGQTVYLGARDLLRGEQIAAQIAGDARAVQLDVTDADSVAAAALQIEKHSGRLDVLVNNAAINTDLGPDGVRAPQSVTADQLRATFDTNVVGLVAITNAVLPMLRRSPSGRIVNLSSGIASLTHMTDPTSRAAQRRLLAYSASKAAVNAITLLYANELRTAAILVNAADPGFVATDMNDHQGTLAPSAGASVAVRLALLPDDGPTGTFVTHDGATVAW